MMASSYGGPEYRCFIGGLAWATDERALEEAFSAFGDILELKIIIDRETGRSRGFGFVTFRDEKSMRDAIERMNGQNLDGRNVTVNEAQSQRSGGGGRSRGGGGGGGRRPGGYGGRREGGYDNGGGYGGRGRDGGYGGGGYGGGGYGGRDGGYGGGRREGGYDNGGYEGGRRDGGYGGGGYGGGGRREGGYSDGGGGGGGARYSRGGGAPDRNWRS